MFCELSLTFGSIAVHLEIFEKYLNKEKILKKIKKKKMNDYTLRNYYSKRKVKIDIVLCNYCNLNCSSCMYGTNTKEIPRLVYDLEQYKKI